MHHVHGLFPLVVLILSLLALASFVRGSERR
jgi:hypothetical protein